MTRVTASELRKSAADVVNQVAYRGERVVVRRRGKDVAALVSMEDLQLLESIEDARDARAAERALCDFERSGATATSLEEVARELGVRLPGKRP
ncbi:MAG TPA: type II toxin-antitoxin system prevent-host-death family antitoxin [Candidatus Hydrogenedentes bacterium]|nr:type II toxin-antitoxin system prevent-host-death family antitoxin [Candidatus Hydrogenedentota bacterium]